MKDKNIKSNCFELIKRSTYGFCMGLSDIIPGYSGGTTLTLLGIYDKLILNSKGVLKPENNSKRLTHFLWLMPFVVFWLITFIGLSFALKYIKIAGYQDFITILFSSFALFCIPIYIIVNKPKITKKENWKSLISFLIGIIIIISISLIIFLLNLNNPVSFEPGTQIIDIFKNNIDQIFLFFFAALFAGFCMIIPGISGSMITYLFNEYWTINYLLTDSIENLFQNLNILFLILFVLVAFIGIILSVVFSSWMIKKYYKQFYSFAFGMVCSSFVAILLVTPKQTWNNSTNVIHIILISIAILLGILINILFIYLYKRKHNLRFRTLFI
ncbi:undecaprenyl phosphate translocase family protein [Mycoplasmoides pirum]|uniref:undecaprenyl phosphate translocase family protein n=1 Tax=Mycoplasmoides pirum TaxID=2122 RepID=UPI0004895F91|nr:DUF368 domain-containing protein [Mycoplasmoides pirum]